MTLKLSSLKTAFILLTFLILGCNPKLLQNSDLENKIFGSIELEKDTFKIGDQILIKFIVSNKSDQNIFFDNYPYGFYINGIKTGGIDVIVQSEKGETVTAKSGVPSMFSGKIGIIKVCPFKTYEFRFYLSTFADLVEIGNYNLFVSKKLNIYLDERRKKSFKNYIKVTLKSDLTFLVVEN